MANDLSATPDQQELVARFANDYRLGEADVVREIERRVCGCDYGGTSWTTRDEAQRFGALMGLRPGLRLLDVGSGSGWPGLYLAETSGCDITLIDLPLAGLRIAAERAVRDGIPGACWAAVGDAAGLPFRDGSFDAVSHSDVLCCLREKRAVLEACRRVIRGGGRMVFSVISVAPGLSPDDHRRAVENGPEFIESEADYPTLLGQTGWDILDYDNITMDYAASCRRQLGADEAQKDQLVKLIGAAEFAERLADWRLKISALKEGLLRRELFVATPDMANAPA
jgi:SAM-dependent methyltransferase